MRTFHRYRIHFQELILPDDDEYVPSSGESDSDADVVFFGTDDEQLEVTADMWHASHQDVETTSEVRARSIMQRVFEKSGSFNFKFTSVEKIGKAENKYASDEIGALIADIPERNMIFVKA